MPKQTIECTEDFYKLSKKPKMIYQVPSEIEETTNEDSL